jgi:hypothetical protein
VLLVEWKLPPLCFLVFVSVLGLFAFPVLFFLCPLFLFLILCSAASGFGGWLLKTVTTMVNAGSRLCAFVR